MSKAVEIQVQMTRVLLETSRRVQAIIPATYDDIVAEAREMDEEEATELAQDALQEALAQAWESLLAVPAYVECYRRDGCAFDANDYDY